MDTDIETLYNLLNDSNYPLTDLKNPSSDFMIKFSLHFLAQHSIDGKAIQRETDEQRDVLTYPELYSDMIICVNLHDVMAKIGDRIFVKDLNIIDLLSPGAKKTRRIISTFLNFGLYTYNKLEELNDPLNDVFSRADTYSILLEKKDHVVDHRVQVVLENSKKIAQRDQKLSLKKKCKEKIACTNKDIEMVMQEQRQADELLQKALAKTSSLKQHLLKVREETAKLELKVVKSPEEYRVKLVSLQKEHADKETYKTDLYQRMQEKKRRIEHIEKLREFVQRQNQKFPQVRKTFQQFKATNKHSEKLTLHLNDLNIDISKLRDIIGGPMSDAGKSKINEIDKNSKNRVAPMYKTRDELQCKKQELEKQLEEAEVRCFELKRENTEVCAKTKAVEKKTKDFLNECQELYNREITKEAEVERSWKTQFLK